MTMTNCLNCGEPPDQHLIVGSLAGGMYQICRRSTYQSASTQGGTAAKDPLPLDKMPVTGSQEAQWARGVDPNSPAAQGHVWDPEKNRWTKPTPPGTETPE